MRVELRDDAFHCGFFKGSLGDRIDIVAPYPRQNLVEQLVPGRTRQFRGHRYGA